MGDLVLRVTAAESIYSIKQITIELLLCLEYCFRLRNILCEEPESDRSWKPSRIRMLKFPSLKGI